MIWIALHFLLAPQWLGSLNLLTGDRGFAFLVGGMAAWLYLSRSYVALTGSKKAVSLIGLTFLVALLWLLQWYGLMGQKPALQALPLCHDMEALLWSGLLLCSLSPLGWGLKLMINRLLSHFGKICYSLYLVHLPIQFYLIHNVKSLLAMLRNYPIRACGQPSSAASCCPGCWQYSATS